MEKVAIIIANWNGKEYLNTCLSSVWKQTYNKFIVIVFDNGSTDGSVDYIHNVFPSTIVISNHNNIGFAKANNRAIEKAFLDPTVQYIATLNNDTEVDAKWLENLITLARANQDVGAIASKILRFHRRNIFDSAGDFMVKNNFKMVNRGAGEEDKMQYNNIVEVLSVCAAGALFKKEALESIKVANEYFDQDFHSYIEDIDICLRLRLHRWKCIYQPEAVMYHVGSATANKFLPILKYTLSRRNMLLVAIKNLPTRYLPLIFMRFIFPIDKLIIYLYRSPWSYINSLYKLFVYNSRNKKTIQEDSQDKLTIGIMAYIYIASILSAIPLLSTMIKKRKLIQMIRLISAQEINHWFHDLSI